MDFFLHIGLIVFIAYIPLFALLTVLAIRRYKGYSFASYWVSNLGDTRFPSSGIFNWAIIFYGLLTIFLIANLAFLLPHIWQSTLAILLMCIASFSVIMEAVIPFNKDIVVHHRYSNIICLTTIGFLLLLWYPLSLVRGFPHEIFILNAAIVLELVLFAVSYIPIEKKLGRIPYTFVDVRKSEKSFLQRNTALLEWGFAALCVCWNVLMALIILQLMP